MNTETMPASGVAADQVTPEATVSTPQEVTAPETSEAEQSTPQESSNDDADKPLKKLQRRVDRVTAARYQAEARAQELERRLAQYEQQMHPESEQSQQVDPYELAKQISTVERVNERSNAVYRDGVKAHGEAFKQAVSSVNDDAGPLFDKRGFPTPLGEAILDSEMPADLIVYLGKNADVAESLQGLSAAQLGRRIAAIESKMATPEPKPSKAPLPLQPVKASGKVQKSPSEMSDDEFATYRRAQIAKRR